MYQKYINKFRSFIVVRPYSTKQVKSKNKTSTDQQNTKIKSLPLITSRRTDFNLFVGDKINRDAKFGDIPLVSSGWNHRKSLNDSFIIHPTKTQSDLDYVHENFSVVGVHQQIVENLKRLNVLRPTGIQSKAIQNILNSEHTLIAAETGCGKTYAYLVPIIHQIVERKVNEQERRNFNTPLGLILIPGRELADQIGRVAEDVSKSMNLNVKVIVGGRTKQQMLNPVFEDVDLLIGTMGAISKLVTTGIYRMDQVRHVVLDEADTLLDDSFNEKLVYFMKRFPFHKNHIQDLGDKIVGTQLVLASATMPTNVEELISQLMNTEMLTEVVSPNLHRILTHVKQRFVRLNKSDRPEYLLQLIKSKISQPIIVFSNKSNTCDFVSMFLQDRGINSVNLNGDMLMKIRIGQFEKFQSGEVNVLATTDVGSRGLDTTRARSIVNFDFPLHVADYIHRCGRTGRVGSPENSQIINFVTSSREIDLVQRIEHSARTSMLLPNVNGNITNIIKTKILKEIDREVKNFMTNVK